MTAGPWPSSPFFSPCLCTVRPCCSSLPAPPAVRPPPPTRCCRPCSPVACLVRLQQPCRVGWWRCRACRAAPGACCPAAALGPQAQHALPSLLCRPLPLQDARGAAAHHAPGGEQGPGPPAACRQLPSDPSIQMPLLVSPYPLPNACMTPLLVAAGRGRGQRRWLVARRPPGRRRPPACGRRRCRRWRQRFTPGRPAGHHGRGRRAGARARPASPAPAAAARLPAGAALPAWRPPPPCGPAAAPARGASINAGLAAPRVFAPGARAPLRRRPRQVRRLVVGKLGHMLCDRLAAAGVSWLHRSPRLAATPCPLITEHHPPPPPPPPPSVLDTAASAPAPRRRRGRRSGGAAAGRGLDAALVPRPQLRPAVRLSEALPATNRGGKGGGHQSLGDGRTSGVLPSTSALCSLR